MFIVFLRTREISLLKNNSHDLHRVITHSLVLVIRLCHVFACFTRYPCLSSLMWDQIFKNQYDIKTTTLHSEKSPARPMLFYSTNYWLLNNHQYNCNITKSFLSVHSVTRSARYLGLHLEVKNNYLWLNLQMISSCIKILVFHISLRLQISMQNSSCDLLRWINHYRLPVIIRSTK